MFSKLKIFPRLMFAFGILVVLIAGLSGSAIHSEKNTALSFLRMKRTVENVATVQQIEKTIFRGRMEVWMALATGEESHWQQAKEDFDTARTRQVALLAQTTNPERRRKVEQLGGTIGDFENKAARVRAIKGRNEALESSDAKTAVTEAAATADQIEKMGTDLIAGFESVSAEATTSVDDGLSDAIDVALGVGIASIVLSLGLSIVVSRGIAGPIKAMTEAMAALADGDLTVAIPATGNKDEIGDMAKAVQVFKDNAVQMEKLRRDQSEAAERGAAERRLAMQALADQFEADVMGVVKVVSESATEMQATAQSMSAAAQQANAQATTVASISEQSSGNVDTIAAATRQLASSIGEIGQQVGQAADISQLASQKTLQTNETVQSLATTANRIGEVVKLINDIASQTNLLALNATIEAARAGDAGKGFAVVAGEVKNLANQTARATDEIGAQISAVQEETRRAVEAIREIGGVIDQVQKISSSIASAIEEQGAATQEIARNVQQAAQGTAEVTRTIDGVSRAAATTGAAAEQVLASSTELAENSERLRSEVIDFLTGVRAG